MATLLEIDESPVTQSPADDSFIGGIPKLPLNVSLPVCTVCGHPMAFLFQVAFPRDHVWTGQSMAAFRCVNEEDDVPNPLPNQGQESGFDIPAGALVGYQDRFRLLGFPTASAVPVSDYAEIVAFRRCQQTPAADDAGISDDGLYVLNRLGGIPAWVQYDESPASYGGAPMAFLLQLEEDFEFTLTPEAAEAAGEDYYTLLLGNANYFFGTAPPAEPAVYVCMQN